MPMAIGEWKQCPRCKETKNVNEFTKAKSARDGYGTYCKDCKASYNPATSRAEFKKLLAQGLKKCSVCNEIKSTDDFYKNVRIPSGFDCMCAECRRAYKKTDRAREVARKGKRKYDQRPDVAKKQKERKKRYRSSEKGKEATKKYTQSEKEKERQARQRKSIQAAARMKVNSAVSSGKIPHISTQKCSVCNQQAKNYHHHLGYAKEHWLDVIPVCVECHIALHSKT